MVRLAWTPFAVPWFFAIVACGSSDAGNEHLSADAGAAAVEAGAGGDAGRAAIGSGGSGGDASGGDAGDGAGGDGGRAAIGPGGSGGDMGDGPGANAAACPKTQPSAGSPCVPTDELGPDGCSYPPREPDCVPVIATCSTLGSWNLRLEPDYGDDTCSEEPESKCPDVLPAVGSACQLQGTLCQYDPAAITICSLCDTWLAGDNGLDCEGAGGAPP